MADALLKTINLNLPDSDIAYVPSFLGEQQAWNCFQNFKDTVPWRQDTITLFGKTHLQPRLTALYASNRKTYSYSNITMTPLPFSGELLRIKKEVDALAHQNFTTCLLNLYRDGRDSNGWHADDEKELGKNPVIASLSLGQERFFHLKHRRHKEVRHKILLEHGSLLLMRGETQHHWLHQVPKTAKPIGERINLTFRVIP
ncbi:MAG: alpha-ketoglutarate-dependent dioxygenase AlkB [Bacteroidota bacterium]